MNGKIGFPTALTLALAALIARGKGFVLITAFRAWLLTLPSNGTQQRTRALPQRMSLQSHSKKVGICGERRECGARIHNNSRGGGDKSKGIGFISEKRTTIFCGGVSSRYANQRLLRAGERPALPNSRIQTARNLCSIQIVSPKYADGLAIPPPP